MVMGQKQPFFSIIVPTYGRPGQLAACLQSLACLDYPRDRFEVIVMDDGSETLPETTVAPFCNQLDVKLLTQPHAGPATARNTAAAAAKGDILAFIDDDCAPASNWLKTLAMRFTSSPDNAIGGRTLNSLPENPYSTASQVLIDYLYSYFNEDPTKARFFSSNNLAMPAEYFHAVGGFDKTFPLAAAEDRELCDRLLYRRYRVIYTLEAVVYHAHPLTLCTFWKQHFRYGRGASHFHRVRAVRGSSGRIKVEPLSFYLNLLRYPSLQRKAKRALLITALLMISQVANAAGFFWETANQTIKNTFHV